MNRFRFWARPPLLRAWAARGFFLAFLLCSTASHGQSQASALTLDDAILKALQNNPRLQVFDVRMRGLQGLEQTAKLRTGFEIEAEIENFAGSGEFQGSGAAEQTVALSSVIEMGGKRAARMAEASARTRLVAAEREAEALELLGDVTQSFATALAAQRRVELAQDALALARTTLQTVRKRAEAGAAPEAEVLRAKAALEQAQIALLQIERAFAVQKVHLAALWGETNADFTQLQGDLFRFPPSDDFESLFARAKDSAAIAVFGNEARVKEAALRLARAQGASDVAWALGARRIEPTGDTALVASVSVPLFSGRRARGEIAAAEAERDQVQLRQEAALLALHAQLFEAYQSRAQSIEAATTLKNTVIPALERALQATRAAYERGRYSYLDLIGAQRELLDAEQSAIDAATSALVFGALIEQLTAEPLKARSTAQQTRRTTDTGQIP